MNFILGYLIGAVLAYVISKVWGNPLEWIFDKWENWNAEKGQEKLNKWYKDNFRGLK